MSQPKAIGDSPASMGIRVAAAALVIVALVILLGASIAGGAWSDGQAPFPFVWRDVAIAYALCALPLAWLLAALIQRFAPPAMLIAMALVVVVLSVLPFLDAVQALLADAVADAYLGFALRNTVGFGLMFSASLAVMAALGRRESMVTTSVRRGVFAVSVAAFALVLCPAIYVNARCRNDLGRLDGLVDQLRLDQALVLAKNVATLDSELMLRGKPLPTVVASLEKAIHELEEQVAPPLAADATDAARMERARQLAMLGQTASAIDVLRPMQDAEADNLRGAIYAARSEWDDGLAAYERAKIGYEARPASDARLAGLTRATTGVAFCHRRAGRYAEAEAAYQELLGIAPTADTHFLLAQFYDDAQQAKKAHFHARRAMEFAPKRYRERGEALIGKMSVFQFGCLRVFAAGGARP